MYFRVPPLIQKSGPSSPNATQLPSSSISSHLYDNRESTHSAREDMALYLSSPAARKAIYESARGIMQLEWTVSGPAIERPVLLESRGDLCIVSCTAHCSPASSLWSGASRLNGLQSVEQSSLYQSLQPPDHYYVPSLRTTLTIILYIILYTSLKLVQNCLYKGVFCPLETHNINHSFSYLLYNQACT